MQFGVFTVGDVTPDPTTGHTVSEEERIRIMVTVALKAEEIGLDVFATGEHHNPPFVPSSPTTMLGYIAAKTERLLLSTATTLITTNDPVKIAEDYAMLQHLADGRVDLMMGRGNMGPVYPWFGQDIRNGIPLAVRELRPPAPPVARGRRRLGGQVPDAADRVHVDAAPARRRAAVRLARLDPQPGDRRAGRLLRRRLLPQQHLLAEQPRAADGRALPPPLRALRPRAGGPGDRRARRPRVHAQELQDAIREFRPYFDHAPVYGGGTSLEDYMAQTPMTIGSPQQVIDRTLGLPRVRRRLPAPAVPRRPRRPAAQDRPRADGHPRRAGRAGPAPRVRGAAARRRAGGPPLHPRVVGRAAVRTRPRPPSPVPADGVRHERARRRALARRRQRRPVGQPSSTPAAGATGWRPPRSATSARPASSRASRSSSCASTPRTSTNHLLTGFPSPTLQAAIDAVLGADGLIAVTPDLQRARTAGCSSCSSTSSSATGSPASRC